MNWRSKAVMVWQAALLASLLAGAGCASTVIPRTVTDSAPSWDGTNQNSGLVGFSPDGGGIITSNARERYNGLVVIYGARFVPALKADAGLWQMPDGTWHIDQQHLACFAKMNRWRKEGRK
jgi:hypothetical protein